MEIDQVYKRVAIIVLILSLVHLLIFNLHDIGMGLLAALIANAGFHGTYFFISLVPPAQVKRLKRKSSAMGNIYRVMSQFMGIMAIFGALAVTGIVIYSAISIGEFERVLVICVMAGLFLGGLKLFKNLKPEI